MTIPDEILDIGWIKINMYIYIRRKCGREGECTLSMREIADTFSLTRPTVSRYLSEMVKMGLFYHNGHQTDTKRTLISLKTNKLNKVYGHQTDTKRTLEERKKDFVERLKPYMEKYGREMLNDFYRYWAQVNDGGTKMLWEKQKCFEIGLRLATWKRNEEKQTKQNVDIGMVIQPTKNRFENEETW